MHSVLGIRHHGPGSSKSMLKALASLQPDLILIEGPPDADKLIQDVENIHLKPPVSILVYDPKNLSEAAYFPFAVFSPEWQAMKFALANNIPTRFMDLPQSLHFGINKMKRENTQIAIDVLLEKESELSDAEKEMQKDPMAFAAKASGYNDSERWWDAMFEKSDNPESIFPEIIELIGAMRKNLPQKSRRAERREAFMRNTIRKAIKEGFQNIAVICGAWHAPALQDLHHYPIKRDNAFLKGIKKVSTKATWVPWTFNRLSTQSGYRSGVISPAYYQLLFHHPGNIVPHWMVKVAQLLRLKELDASSAHVIEAVRLTHALSAMRNLSVPGLDEMFEAAVAIFCDGYSSKMELIEQKLIVGDVIGTVPPEIPLIPLQQDLEKTIKSALLSKEKNSTDKKEKVLDLRKPKNLLASHLLHRLNLLGIPWGTQQQISKRDHGSFKEIWELQWLPDFAINIIEAGMWGNTVYAAASNYVMAKAREVQILPELTSLVQATLNADLSEAIQEIVIHLKDLSALTKDIHNLMEALPALVNAIRYGSTRKMDLSAISHVIDNIIPRICIGLPNACSSVDEDMAQEVFQRIIAVNQSLNILNDGAYLKSWYEALFKVSKNSGIKGSIRGGAVRILFDKEYFDFNDTVTSMRYALSPANDSMDSAQWLEGFLYGSGLLLIHQPALWNILDEWIDDLPMSPVFEKILPLLRRTFSAFSVPERQKMMRLAHLGNAGHLEKATSTEIDYDPQKAAQVLSAAKTLLGL